MHIYFDMEVFSALVNNPDYNCLFLFFFHIVCVYAAVFNAVIVSIMIQ